MKDRISQNPGRVLITPENGSAPFYATMTRADNPTQDGDPISKETLLKDATAALFGLGADAVPDDALFKLAPFVCYFWNKKTPLAYEEARLPFSSDYFYVVDNKADAVGTTIQYSDSITIDHANGTFELNNPTSVQIIRDTRGEAFETLKGKYIKNGDSDPENIYFISASATGSTDYYGGTFYVKYTGTYVYKIALSPSEYTEEIVFDPDRNAYPDRGIVDGTEYVFLGKPLENAITSLGFGAIEHVGAGTFGNIDIIFPVIPKIVFFNCGTEKQEVSPYIWGLDSLTVNTGSVNRISVIPSGKTLTVKSNSSTLNALDTSGVVYTVAYLY